MEIAIVLLVWAASVVALYLIIFYAVKHAMIAATRPRPAAPETPMPPRSPMWFERDGNDG